MTTQQQPGRPWTRNRTIRTIWVTCFVMVAGTYTVGVVRTLFDGGSLPSALWLPESVRRDWVAGMTISYLAVALLASLISWLWWAKNTTT